MNTVTSVHDTVRRSFRLYLAMTVRSVNIGVRVLVVVVVVGLGCCVCYCGSDDTLE